MTEAPTADRRTTPQPGSYNLIDSKSAGEQISLSGTVYSDHLSAPLPVPIGGSRVHSSECIWLRAVAGREDLVSAKSLAPRVLARDG